MNNLRPLYFFIGTICTVLLCFSFITTPTPNSIKLRANEADNSINWMTWNEAIAANANTPKKTFVYIKTGWCGWCKRMDGNAFINTAVITYLNENFYPVKLDAEMKEEIIYKGHTFKYVNNGRRGHHELAASLMDDRMSYPTIVALDESEDRITIAPGFKDSTEIMPILTYIGDDNYKSMSFKEYEEKLAE